MATKKTEMLLGMLPHQLRDPDLSNKPICRGGGCIHGHSEYISYLALSTQSFGIVISFSFPVRLATIIPQYFIVPLSIEPYSVYVRQKELLMSLLGVTLFKVGSRKND